MTTTTTTMMDLSNDLKELVKHCAVDENASYQYVRIVSFMQGLLLGQVSVLVVVFFVIRYLLMEDVKRVKKRYIPSRLSTAPHYRTNPAMTSAPPVALITSKTYYDIIHHPPESTDWLNVLFAQAILQYRDDAKINNRLMLSIDELINGGVRPNFVGPIHVTELNLGDEFPIFSNARIRPSDEIGSMRAEIDFEYNDQVTLGIETQVILNWPRQSFAALPVSLLLSVVRFSGTLTIELINPPETTTKPDKPLERYIAISSYPDFVLDLQIKVPNLWEERDRKSKEAHQLQDQGLEKHQQQQQQQQEKEENGKQNDYDDDDGIVPVSKESTL
ncbi:uncharacterized protein BX664DRAFT_301121 [Halteromyces radiatus]|uniref:uncharacterized protein n=1 Tax=Halteromyces radiatus TaxID=101107 RepID=UPI00222088D5|nr:uncharacterized protein BX664DRAFT_301121 [Halteromyces radiatus]KAI8082732.1 hypothetical protein BX664DRAFT_301121 [Halteromyces radiatus]